LQSRNLYIIIITNVIYFNGGINLQMVELQHIDWTSGLWNVNI